jgi:ATP-dependent Clp protease ATP-binding subunit ClpB
MRIDKLTSKLQSALADAQSMSLGGDNNFIEPSHLLLSLMDQKGGSVHPLMSQTGFDITDLRAKLQTLVDDLPKLQDSTGEISVSSDLAKMLNQADKTAQQKGDSFVSSETILLVAMRDAGAVG